MQHVYCNHGSIMKILFHIKTFFVMAVTSALSTSFVVSLLFTITMYHYMQDLPSYDRISTESLPTVSRMYSFDQHLLTQFSTENRIFIPINSIPKHIINSFIVAEDKTFYHNTGIDYFAILRAIISNLTSSKSLVGGSTITQQVVKNCLLTTEKSIKRKVQEILLSLQMNKMFSKDQIMELYLNKIYFGQRSYGIGVASLQYFNKSVNELNVSEAALLASLPQAPSKLNPFRNTNNIYDRRNWVLDRLAEENYITYQELQIYKNQKIKINSSYQEKLRKNDFFIEEVRKQIVKNYGEQNLYNGGLYIHTTLNSKIHNIATEALKKNIEEYALENFWSGKIDHISTENWCEKLADIRNNYQEYIPESWSFSIVLKNDSTDSIIGNENCDTKKLQHHPKISSELRIGDIVLTKSISRTTNTLRQNSSLNGGVVIIDPENGNILSMVGGYSFEKNQYNIITQANRQPGSLLKPFVYLEALKQNFTPFTLIGDEPISLFQGNHLPFWSPKNYENTFFGATSLKRGLELSRNIITVQISRAIGLQAITKGLKNFQIYDNPEAIYSITLGSQIVDLLSLTKAYAILANHGQDINLSMIEKIQDKYGKTLFSHRKQELCQYCNFSASSEYLFPILSEHNKIISPSNSTYQITHVLQDSIKHGTSKNLKDINLPFAAKTGTSNDNKDTWIIGYSPKIVIGVYVGFDTPHSLGKHATGARVALPIMKDIITALEPEIIKVPFKVPPDIIFKKINTKNLSATQNKNHQNIKYMPIKNYEMNIINAHNEYMEVLAHNHLSDVLEMNKNIAHFNIYNIDFLLSEIISEKLPIMHYNQDKDIDLEKIIDNTPPIDDKYTKLLLTQERNKINMQKHSKNTHKN